MLDLAQQQLVALPAAALARLRDTAAVDPTALQEAGYAAGGALYDAFGAWLASRGERAPDELEIERAQTEAARFFADAGWGEIEVTPLGAAVAVDSPRWAEATAGGREHPSCFMGTGVLAGFFGRLADAPLAVLEVECRSAGAPRCRFLLGSADVLDSAYEDITSGSGYLAAVGE